ncbi:MAG: tellurite resistance TerB family protein [Prochloraceae cyanobacterium]
MGLFDRLSQLRPQPEDNLDPAESFTGLMIAAIAADGQISEEEARLVAATLSRMKLFQDYTNDRLVRTNEKILRILQQQGPEYLVKIASEGLPQELYDTAFAIAADLILSDGVVSEQEQQLLNDLYHFLSLNEQTAQTIIDVMMIKNKG